jgi:phosphoenolpyruvate-protein kinase (PTS system EI component)
MPTPANRAEPDNVVGEVAFEGIAGSSGIAVGPAIVLDRRRGTVRRHVSHAHIEDEIERFDGAVAAAAGRGVGHAPKGRSSTRTSR